MTKGEAINHAIVCVVIDATDPILISVRIQVENEDDTRSEDIEVFVENLPAQCLKCGGI